MGLKWGQSASSMSFNAPHLDKIAGDQRAGPASKAVHNPHNRFIQGLESQAICENSSQIDIAVSQAIGRLLVN